WGSQVRMVRPDAIGAVEELHCRGLDISRLVGAAIYDDERAEPRGGICERGVWFCSGKQDGGEKHGEAGDSGGPTVPETERQNDERSAGEGEDDAEGEPASA